MLAPCRLRTAALALLLSAATSNASPTTQIEARQSCPVQVVWQTCPVQVVSNPGFSAGLSSWTVSSPQTPILSQSYDAYSGSQALEIPYAWNPLDPGLYVLIDVSQQVTVCLNQTYTFEAYLKVTNNVNAGCTASLCAQWKTTTSLGFSSGCSASQVLTSSYQRLSETITPNSNTNPTTEASLSIVIICEPASPSNSSARVFIDQANMFIGTTNPDPATPNAATACTPASTSTAGSTSIPPPSSTSIPTPSSTSIPPAAAQALRSALQSTQNVLSDLERLSFQISCDVQNTRSAQQSAQARLTADQAVRHPNGQISCDIETQTLLVETQEQEIRLLQAYLPGVQGAINQANATVQQIQLLSRSLA